MSVIKKVIIPVAGLGTRMLPATKAIPKEMLPLVDRPLIQLIVDECVAAGIKEIILVTHSSKNAIENHFDKNFELESTLDSKNKHQLLDEVRAICPADVSIVSVRQGAAQGLGHAVLCAQSLVGEQPFAVLLPDVIMDNLHGVENKSNNLASMIQRYESTSISQVMVSPIPEEDVSNYGIVDCQGVEANPGESVLIKRVVEKPARDSAPSNLSIVGRYILPPEIWPILASTLRGSGGEIQLTDAISTLMESQPVAAYAMVGSYYDCGNKLGYAQTFVESAMAHPDIGPLFHAWLTSKFA